MLSTTDQTAAEPAAKPAKKYVVPANAIQPGRVATYQRGHYHMDVGNEVTIADLMRPGAWAHHIRNVKPRDIIDVLSEDMALDLQLRVLNIENGMIEMRLMQVFSEREGEETVTEPEEHESDMPDVPDGYKVGFTPARRHFVQYRGVSPPEIVLDDFATRREAIEAAIDHKERAGN